MGSTCCDCQTDWETWKYEFRLTAEMISKSTTPSQCPDRTMIAAGYPCSHYFEGPSTNWPKTFVVKEYTPAERIMKSGPTPSLFCDCTNTNGGTKSGKDNPFEREELNKETLLTKERKTDKDRWVHDCTPVYFDKIPATTIAYYKFVLTISRIPESWYKDHKCGPDCPGDSKVDPELFDKKSEIRQQFIHIANDYKFSN